MKMAYFYYFHEKCGTKYPRLTPQDGSNYTKWTLIDIWWHTTKVQREKIAPASKMRKLTFCAVVYALTYLRIDCVVALTDDSARNLSSRSGSSPKVQENACFTFSSHSPPLKGLFFKTYISGSRLTSGAKHEKIGTWEVTGIAQRRVQHHTFRRCRSRFFTSGDYLQCTLYSTLYSVRLMGKVLCAITQSRYDSIPCCVHDMMCKHAISLNCNCTEGGAVKIGDITNCE